MEIEGNTESTYGTTAASKIEGWDVKIASNSAGATCAEKYKGGEFHNLPFATTIQQVISFCLKE